MFATDVLEFTWQSYLFALVSFLLLVGLLAKFLHRPLLDVLAKRRQTVEDATREADDKAREADATRQDYEQRLAGIEEQRDKLLTEARQQADAAREELLVKARADADREVANLRQDWERQKRDALESLEGDIVDASLDLAGRVLAKLSTREVDARLADLLDRQLADLAEKTDVHARQDMVEGDAPVRVVSAKALDTSRQQEIAARIQALTDATPPVDFNIDEALVAGVRVEFSSMAVDATLADLLAATRERFEQSTPAGAGGES